MKEISVEQLLVSALLIEEEKMITIPSRGWLQCLLHLQVLDNRIEVQDIPNLPVSESVSV